MAAESEEEIRFTHAALSTGPISGPLEQNSGCDAQGTHFIRQREIETYCPRGHQAQAAKHTVKTLSWICLFGGWTKKCKKISEMLVFHGDLPRYNRKNHQEH